MAQRKGSKFYTRFIETLQDLQKIHDFANQIIDSGLKVEEDNDYESALEDYRTGLELIDHALHTDVNQLTGCSDDFKEKANEILMKMKVMRKDLLGRVKNLLKKDDSTCSSSKYQSFFGSKVSKDDDDEDDELTYNLLYQNKEDLKKVGTELMTMPKSPGHHTAKAEELFVIPEAVSLFSVSADGSVQLMCTSPLSILKFNKDLDKENAVIFLLVGDWIYPLIPAQSPVLLTRYGAFIFPDISPTHQGSAVSIMLPDDLSMNERKAFYDLLVRLALVIVQEEKEATPAPQKSKISSTILSASEKISNGILKGVEKTSNLIKFGSSFLQHRSKKCEANQQVNPKIKQGVLMAKKATKEAVDVTDLIVRRVGEATVLLAEVIAPPIGMGATKLMGSSSSSKNLQSPLMQSVVDVTSCSYEGFSLIYESLVKAGQNFRTTLADETIEVVRHNYGDEVAELTDETMQTAGNMVMAVSNVKNLGVKSIAKETAIQSTYLISEELKKAKVT